MRCFATVRFQKILCRIISDMHNFARRLSQFYFRVFLSPLNVSNRRLNRSLNELLLREIARISDKNGFIFRAKFDPKKRLLVSESSTSDVFILIQGPISDLKALEDVKETIRTYTANYPAAKVVLSTWDNSLALTDNFINEHGVTVVITKDPGPSWPNNLKRQMVSTQNGLRAMDARASSIVIKTRTDQRINNPLGLNFIESMIQQFPGQGRIWATDYGTGRYRLYGLSDQMQFGLYCHLSNFWNTASIEELHENIFLGKNSKGSDIARMSIAVHEILLTSNYLNTLKHPILWTWEDHLFCLKNFFGIIDSTFIGLELLSRNRTPIDHVIPGMLGQQIEIEHHLAFEEWMSVLFGKNLPTPEKSLLIHALKVPMSDQILVQSFWEKRNNM